MVPILHTKMMSLGHLWWHDEGADGHVEDVIGFTPQKLWPASANGTSSSRRNLDRGHPPPIGHSGVVIGILRIPAEQLGPTQDRRDPLHLHSGFADERPILGNLSREIVSRLAVAQAQCAQLVVELLEVQQGLRVDPGNRSVVEWLEQREHTVGGQRDHSGRDRQKECLGVPEDEPSQEPLVSQDREPRCSASSRTCEPATAIVKRSSECRKAGFPPNGAATVSGR